MIYWALCIKCHPVQMLISNSQIINLKFSVGNLLICDFHSQYISLAHVVTIDIVMFDLSSTETLTFTIVMVKLSQI